MRVVLPLVLMVMLAACGGGGTGTTTGGGTGAVPAPPAPPAPARGSVVGGGAATAPILVSGVSVGKIEPQVLTVLLETLQTGTTTITGEPKCAIATYRVKYNTVGGAGEATDASAAIMVPSGSDASCSGSRPVLLYAHATSVEQSFDMANLAGNSEARLVAAMFAAQGFIVVAPNYAGYAGSSLPYHPYLDANQQGADMIDALRAARASFAAIGARDSGKLLLTGYSQGGHVALATQRAMQGLTAEFKLTAVAALSGPYALSQFGDSIFAGSPRLNVTTFLSLLVSAGQHAGAALYTTPGEVFEPKYVATIETLLPGTASLGELIGAGKLPAMALFARDSQPQASGYGLYFGDGNLIRSSYRSAYLADLQAHPCNASVGAPLNCAPTHALRKLLVKNDLRNYVPAAPLMLCGGNGDPTVPYQNTVSALAYLRAAPGAAAVTEVDLDTVPGLSDPYRNEKLSFLAAKVALRADALKSGSSGDQAVESNYHAGLVPPFCMTATRQFFQAALLR